MICPNLTYQSSAGSPGKRFNFLLMAPSSQSLEPPQNLGRFTRMTLKYLSVKRAAASAGLSRLEQAGLIQVAPWFEPLRLH